jgi:hypothetical protein
MFARVEAKSQTPHYAAVLDHEKGGAMRLQGWKKYGLGGCGMLMLVMAVLLATGWGSAVAAQIQNVFITNDSAHAVPVQTPIPATSFSVDVSLGEVGVVSGPDPAGTKYAITGVVVANTDASPAFVRVAARYGSITDCTDLTGTVGTNEIPIFVPAFDTVNVSFTQPFVIKAGAGAAACLIVAPSFAGGGRAAVVGYRIN